MRTKLKKKLIYHNFGLSDEFEDHYKTYKSQWKKSEIKRIRVKLKKHIYNKLGLKDEIENK